MAIYVTAAYNKGARDQLLPCWASPNNTSKNSESWEDLLNCFTILLFKNQKVTLAKKIYPVAQQLVLAQPWPILLNYRWHFDNRITQKGLQWLLQSLHNMSNPILEKWTFISVLILCNSVYLMVLTFDLVAKMRYPSFMEKKNTSSVGSSSYKLVSNLPKLTCS